MLWRDEAGPEELAEKPKWRGKIILEILDLDEIDFEQIRWRREKCCVAS